MKQESDQAVTSAGLKTPTSETSGGASRSSSELSRNLKTATYEEGRAMVSPDGAGAGKSAGAGAEVSTRAKPRLVDGISVGSPTTYDASGGHSYGRHGAHTTKAQHQERLRSGTAPNGDRAPVPSSAPGSSKFDSNALHQKALEAGLSKLVEKNKNRQDPRTFKGINTKIGVSGAGTIFQRDGAEKAAGDVHMDLRKVGTDGEFNLNTAFPTD